MGSRRAGGFDPRTKCSAFLLTEASQPSSMPASTFSMPPASVRLSAATTSKRDAAAEKTEYVRGEAPRGLMLMFAIRIRSLDMAPGKRNANKTIVPIRFVRRYDRIFAIGIIGLRGRALKPAPRVYIREAAVTLHDLLQYASCEVHHAPVFPEPLLIGA